MACLLASLPLAMAAQRQWTLKQCIDYALENNITLKTARLQQMSAAEEVAGSKAQLLPTLNASTNHSLGYRPWQDNGTTTVTNGQVNAKMDKHYYNGSYGLNASWTVWNGNRNRNNIVLSKYSEQQASLNIDQTANSIQEEIARYYVQILYLKEAVKVSQASLETSRKNEERGEQMVQVGKMSKADLAQLSAQRASDEYNIVEAQSQVATYLLRLKQLLELPGDEQLDVATPSATNEQALQAIPPLQAVYQAALASRPEIASAQVAIKSSDVSLKVAKGGRLPTLSMSSGIGTSTNSLSNNSFGNQLKFNFDGSVGATLSIPILDQRTVKTNVAKARLQQSQAQLDLEDQQKKLYQTIESCWLDAQNNQQKYRAATKTVESEQASYDLLQEQFRLGLKNIVELMTGKDRLLSAQQNMLQAKYVTILNQHLLKFYAGQ